MLQGITVNVTGSLRANGGNGGAGGSASNHDNGEISGYPGGGGGGGRIVVYSPNTVNGVLAGNGSNASGPTGGTPSVAIQQSTCAPTISGIQVNGVVTNTIIAGTTGYVAIYGSCLAGAISVQSSGAGLQLPTVTYTADGQVNVSYQASNSAATGTQTVTINTVNGATAEPSISRPCTSDTAPKWRVQGDPRRPGVCPTKWPISSHRLKPNVTRFSILSKLRYSWGRTPPVLRPTSTVGLFVRGYGWFRCAKSGSWRTRADLEVCPTE